VRWKRSTNTLPDAARADAPYVRAGHDSKSSFPFCLPRQFAPLNLLPEVRDSVLGMFAVLKIPWHAGVEGGPSNHLLSSQVQCANALGQMVVDDARIKLAFGDLDGVDIAEVTEIETGHLLTFEFIGLKNYLGEWPKTGLPTRGANCTSVDAAFAYRTSDGAHELALVEWKYTESYLRKRPESAKGDETRLRRYGELYAAGSGPLDPRAPFDLMLDEPFYQLMRQQLLAHAIEQDPEQPFDAVRVLHVLDPSNREYQASIVRPEMKELGDSVDAIWMRLLRDETKFVHVDPRVFRDPRVTSEEYVSRYPGQS
jgi:hypothetical protein